MFIGFQALSESGGSGRLVRPGDGSPAPSEPEASAGENDLNSLVTWLSQGAVGEKFTPRMVADVLRNAGVSLEALVAMVKKKRAANVAEEMSSLVSFGAQEKEI